MFTPEYDNPGVLRSLPTSRLTSGLAYQRPVNERVVNLLIRDWDEQLLEPLIVSFRDGRFHLVDGQHRVIALRRKNGGSDVMVLCRVYSGLTYEQEAELCFKLDKIYNIIGFRSCKPHYVVRFFPERHSIGHVPLPEALPLKRSTRECSGRRNGKIPESQEKSRLSGTRILSNFYSHST